MQEIIKKLCEIEDRAQKIYENSATIFSEDKELSDLLRRLSEDEKVHHKLIADASELIKGSSDLPALAYIDDDTRLKIDNHFLTCEQKIRTNKITKEDIINFIVAAEYSEWNDWFAYVTNALKHRYREFIPAAASIQQHKRSIERFLGAKPEFAKYLDAIRKILSIWEERILVVDDEPIIADVLTAILGDEGNIDIAVNGEDALKKLGNAYYAAIVTDIDMPVMTGIEFYREASERYPNVKGRFLFFTGALDEERVSFFKQNNIKYLRKPSMMSDIKKAIVDILNRTLLDK